ncbi:MAG TPA: hypothetical protein VJK51_00730 [Candidatus Nanoarchaeia archaeon]|nr:hypothetical protein [Candidatus Nanoarchaeia archaeon]
MTKSQQKRSLFSKGESQAQAWGFDIIIAVIIFTAGILVLFIYTLNYPGQSQEKINDMQKEGSYMLSILLSEGNPSNWTTETVIQPGLLSNNRLNDTKLSQWHTLSQTNYPLSKQLLNAKYNHYLYLSEPFTFPSAPGGIGQQPSNTKNRIKITRLSLYNNKPVTVFLEVWE